MDLALEEQPYTSELTCPNLAFQMMSCLKHGVVAHSAFAEMAEANVASTTADGSSKGKGGPVGGGI